MASYTYIQQSCTYSFDGIKEIQRLAMSILKLFATLVMYCSAVHVHMGKKGVDHKIKITNLLS